MVINLKDNSSRKFFHCARNDLSSRAFFCLNLWLGWKTCCVFPLVWGIFYTHTQKTKVQTNQNASLKATTDRSRCPLVRWFLGGSEKVTQEEGPICPTIKTATYFVACPGQTLNYCLTRVLEYDSTCFRLRFHPPFHYKESTPEFICDWTKRTNAVLSSAQTNRTNQSDSAGFRSAGLKINEWSELKISRIPQKGFFLLMWPWSEFVFLIEQPLNLMDAWWICRYHPTEPHIFKFKIED